MEHEVFHAEIDERVTRHVHEVAGNGLLEGMLDLLPSARIGHIGLYRDPVTLKPVEYYFKVPSDIDERPVIVVDRVARTQAGVKSLVQLAELVNATVIDQGGRMNFPNQHPLYARGTAAIAQADVIVGLELTDFFGTVNEFIDSAEAQPFYVNSPFGLVLGHNGNLTNSEKLKEEMFRQDLRHINTNSDSEVLLNVLAHELQDSASNYKLDPATIFKAVSGVHRRCRGAYAVVVMIAGSFGAPSGLVVTLDLSITCSGICNRYRISLWEGVIRP